MRFVQLPLGGWVRTNDAHLHRYSSLRYCGVVWSRNIHPRRCSCVDDHGSVGHAADLSSGHDFWGWTSGCCNGTNEQIGMGECFVRCRRLAMAVKMPSILRATRVKARESSSSTLTRAPIRFASRAAASPAAPAPITTTWRGGTPGAPPEQAPRSTAAGQKILRGQHDGHPATDR